MPLSAHTGTNHGAEESSTNPCGPMSLILGITLHPLFVLSKCGFPFYIICVHRGLCLRVYPPVGPEDYP